ncbi:hypothetical protein ACHHYP_05899 [Achlya hypogyna]|uniref:Ornithine decarboxylase n=1 Tax=Achlya hypogyna TaxID=1202772 RepID=A0A1V9YW94_ACHHY|nr:hypothetical protein ACHHYP_05899 [Achlya hypogyna]
MAFAQAHGVAHTTFDSTFELEKIAVHFPSAQVVLRIECDDPNALVPFHGKFGAQPTEWEALLEKTKSLGLSLAGVAFHVGSGCTDPHVYHRAMDAAQDVLHLARKFGFEPHLLDLGGGFSYPLPPAIVAAVRAKADALQAQIPKLTLIAEPGRYFAETTCVHYTKVVGKRVRGDKREYWIEDGIYGHFADVGHGYMVATPLVVAKDDTAPVFESRIYGGTCDGIDVVVPSCVLPDLPVGAWLYFENMGAYTNALATSFNGIDAAAAPRVYKRAKTKGFV